MKEAFPGMPGKESQEGRELFRATLGFDFLFTRNEDGSLHCYCIEINGHDTGIKGVEDVPQEQIGKQYQMLAGIRAKENPEMSRRYDIANAVLRDMRSGTFQPTPEAREKIIGYMKKSLRAAPTAAHAYHNPDFIEDITRDKRLQERYIPLEYAVHTWHSGVSPVSSTGRWVLKRFDSRGGDDVHVLTNREFDELIENEEEPFLEDEYVVQEFLPPGGAEMLPGSVGKRATSMRLLMDFRVLDDGSILTDYSTAYQRVSPHEADDARFSDTRKYVVNRAKGASSAGVSPAELELGRKAAEAIIRTITAAYERQRGGEGERPV